jgi:serine protease Do
MSRTLATTRTIALLVIVALCLSGGSNCRHWLKRGSGGEAELASGSSFAVSPVFADPQGATLADVAESRVDCVVNISSTRIVRSIDGPMLSPFFDDPFFKRFFGPLLQGVPRERREKSLGSGVIVSDDGIVLTNNHVVQDTEDIKVMLADEREFDAEIVGSDPKSDVAVIRLEGDPQDLQPIPFGDSSALRLGEVVLAIGSPFGLGHTVTMGIVSALGRANVGITDYEDFIQTDAAINPGNSGGALINLEGELIGINTALVSRTGGYQGIGLAIPSDMARSVLDSILEHGKVVRGWLGVVIQDIDKDLADALGLESTRGVLVADVTEDSPAHEAGIERGDVILEIAGEDVTSPGMLRNRVAALGAGAEVELVVVRDGKKKTIEVTLGELPEQIPDESAHEEERKLVSGLVVAPLDPVLRAQFGIPEDIQSGVVVTGIDQGSSAQQSGLRVGDVVLEVDGEKVGSVEDFAERVDESEDEALLLIYRDGVTIFLVLEG